MKPKYLIFDVDNTLLDFGAVFYRGQEAAAKLLGLPCTAEFRALDEKCGWRAWKECRLDDTHLEEVQQHYHEYYYQYVKNHYVYLLENLGLSFDVELLTQNYLDCAAAISTPMEEDALQVYSALAERYSLAIATNGTEIMQISRLWDYLPHTKAVFISERVGQIKPTAAFFDHMLHSLSCDPADCLMIGDSLSNDILGAQQAGMKTCYYNPRGKAISPEIKPDYEIQNLRQLLTLLP